MRSPCQTPPTFEQLVAEDEAAPVEGWDFAWLQGHAVEQRPSWGYQRLIAQRLAVAGAALDIQTGGGEVLAGVARLPATTAVTESWPPNVAKATRLLHPARRRRGRRPRRATASVRRRSL